jgi:serine/threonine protein kinase
VLATATFHRKRNFTTKRTCNFVHVNADSNFLRRGIAPHPNLVQTFGVSLDGPNPCIVLEYCGGGSLDQVLYDSSAVLSVEKQREYAMKIAYGLLHLHNNNIVHRDLAARNILVRYTFGGDTY